MDDLDLDDLEPDLDLDDLEPDLDLDDLEPDLEDLVLDLERIWMIRTGFFDSIHTSSNIVISFVFSPCFSS